jgi:thiol-disulfide isomerase/thioredoxin
MKRNLLLSLLLAATPAAAFAAPPATSPAPATQPSAADLIHQFLGLRPPHYDQARHDDKAYNAAYDAALNDFFAHRIAIAKQFVDLYPDHKGAAPLLQWSAQASRNPVEQSTFYRRLATNYPDTDEGKLAVAHVHRDDIVGHPIDLAFTDAITGRKVDLKDYRGKLVLIDFWATWCPLCVEAMPHVKSLYQKYHDQGLEIIGVNLDNAEPEGSLDRVKQFVAENQIPWPQFYQDNGWESPFSHSFGIDALPAMFVIAPDGNVAATHTVPSDLDTLIPTLLPKPQQKPAK